MKAKKRGVQKAQKQSNTTFFIDIETNIGLKSIRSGSEAEVVSIGISKLDQSNKVYSSYYKEFNPIYPLGHAVPGAAPFAHRTKTDLFWHLLRANAKYDKEEKENPVNFNMVRLVLHYLHNMRLIHLLFTNLIHAPSTSKGRNFRWSDQCKAFAGA